MQPKRVLCIQDIACVGRCSLAVVLPALSAMGLQACPLPTALLPTHPLGFAAPAHTDETAFCKSALASFDAQGIAFDAVLSGYLASAGQAQLVADAFVQNPRALKVADPVMADHGKLYHNRTEALCSAIRTLCAVADVITPNATESAVLLGLPPCDDAMDDAFLTARLHALHAAYPHARCIVITGVRHADGRSGNAVFSAAQHGHALASGCLAAAPCSTFLPYEAVPASFPGTGDLFAALLTGGLLLAAQGSSDTADAQDCAAAQHSVQQAAAFLTRAAQYTLAHGGQPRYGVQFEPLLGELAALVAAPFPYEPLAACPTNTPHHAQSCGAALGD